MRHTNKQGRTNRSFSCYDDEWQVITKNAETHGFRSVSDYIWDCIEAYEGVKKLQSIAPLIEKVLGQTETALTQLTNNNVVLKVPEGFTCDFKLKEDK